MIPTPPLLLGSPHAHCWVSLFCCSPSLAMPVACGPPLRSAAQSGPATSAVPFHSPLQQTRCPASASWARKTPPLSTLLPPLLQLMTWDRPTTPGGYGAPQLEEEALTLGLIHTSLMKIKIKQKTKVGAPHLDHDMPVSKTSSKALTAVASLSPPPLCRAGLFHSLLSDLSCNYDTLRFDVVLVDKSLDSATNYSPVHLNLDSPSSPPVSSLLSLSVRTQIWHYS